MYNRYIRNDQGTYTRIPEEDTPPRTAPEGPPPPPSGGMSLRGQSSQNGLFGGFPPVGGGDLRKLLDRFHLDRIDSGDLLLLGLLFLLYREGADEELLFALGLLLIL